MSKKLLVLTLGALLVVFMAGSALAATSISFSGSYQVRGFYLSNPEMKGGDENTANDGEVSSAWFDHDLYIYTTFKVTDALSLKLNINAYGGQMWGDIQANRWWGSGAEMLGASGPGGAGAINDSSPEFYQCYMQIKTQYGLFYFGRMAGGQAGLIMVPAAQASPVSAPRYVFDSEASRDRFKWFLPLGKAGLLFVYEKSAEKGGQQAYAARVSDYDMDQWAFAPMYNWEHGHANVLFALLRDRHNVDGTSLFTAIRPRYGNAGRVDVWFIHPALRLNYDMFEFNTELYWASGTADFNNPALQDIDVEDSAYYFDLQYKYGPGKIGLMYLWCQGDDDQFDASKAVKDNKDSVAILRSGADFQPLYAAYGAYDGLRYNTDNHQLISLWWDHSLTEDLMLHAAYGWIKINKPGKTAGGANISDDYGSEFDLGIAYKLMNNLEYQAHFGYFMPGDFWKGGVQNMRDPGNHIHLDHQLVLSF